jgi:hypothetical protein
MSTRSTARWDQFMVDALAAQRAAGGSSDPDTLAPACATITVGADVPIPPIPTTCTRSDMPRGVAGHRTVQRALTGTTGVPSPNERGRDSVEAARGY